MTTDTNDYDRLLQANLARVFGERAAEHRITAVADLYTADAVLYEPEGVATGHAAIDRAVATLLSSLPHEFSFTAIGLAVGHHGLGRLRWQAGPPGGPVAVTGTDVAQIEHGRIRSLYVFIDPPAA